MKQKLVVAHQPACSNVLLVSEDGSIQRLYQGPLEYCRQFALGYELGSPRVRRVPDVRLGPGNAVRLYYSVA